MRARAGDKVRLKAGSLSGVRGTIKSSHGDTLIVALDDSGRVVQVRSDNVTNYSLAARKAWVTEPNRDVGRRKGTRLSDRVSVTLRLDRLLWKRFQELEGAGLIDDRTAVVNLWFREKLAELDGEPES